MAHSLGVSLKRWSGWEPRQVTEYEHDEAGRVVRAVSVREVEWDDDERSWMLALAQVKADACPGCGGHLPETTALANDDGYVAGEPLRCHRCTALEIRATQVRSRQHATTFRIWPVQHRND